MHISIYHLGIREIQGIRVHYEYMALAKKTSDLREAMLICFEPQSICAPQNMRTHFEAMLNNKYLSGYLFATQGSGELRALPISLPKIRRQRVLQAFSIPGAEQLQKLLSVGP